MSDDPIEPVSATEHPPGDYAIVELFGHSTLVGRFAEVERFGTKMLALEPIFKGKLLDAVFHGGASIYRLTPCSASVAFLRAPTRDYQLPPTILAAAPPELLAAPVTEPGSTIGVDDDEAEDPFGDDEDP